MAGRTLDGVTRAAAALGTVASITACAATTASTARSPTPSAPSPTSSASPTAAPSPDVRSVDVLATGVGTYLDTTVPLALLRNRSTTQEATGVVVHIVAGRLGPAGDVTLARLLPGETVVVAARVGGSGRGVAVTATAAVGGWDPVDRGARPIAVGSPTLACPGCSAAGGSGDVGVTLPLPPAGVTLRVDAACRDAGGSLVGGGDAKRSIGAASSGPVAVDVPVILSVPAASCLVTAVPVGGF